MEHADTIPLAFFLVHPWYFGKEGIYLCGGLVNAPFTSPTKGVYLAQGPSFCVRKFVLVMAEAVFPKGTFSQWLRVSDMLRLAIPGRHGTSLMVTLAWGLHDGLAELSLELYCGLRYFHSTFLPSFLHWESDLHPKSPSLPGFFIFSYRCSPWYISCRSNPALLSASQKPGLTRSPVLLWSSAGLSLPALCCGHRSEATGLEILVQSLSIWFYIL